MTDEQLEEIREIMQGEDDPGTVWWFETIEDLLAERERMQRALSSYSGREHNEP